MKKIFTVIVAILAILIVLSFGKNLIAKQIFAGGVKAITGLRLSIRSMNLGILKTLVDIRGLKIYNPSGFKDRLMADIPQIYVDYSLASACKGKIHFSHLKLNLKELVVAKNEDGKTNLNSLKSVKAKEEAPAERKEEVKKSKLQIDVLELKVDKVIYKDYSEGSPPKIREYNVNIDERYENIDDPQALTNLILVKALMNTTIANITDFNVKALAEDTSKALKKGAQKTKDAAGKAVETGKEIGAKATDVAGEAVDKTKKALEDIFSFGE